MASSYIEWDSPNINFDDETVMKAFFKDFDDKLQESGLIKIDSESFDYTQPTPFPAGSMGQSRTVATYTYQFPKGFAKTEFEDIAGQDYKKIKRASYFKTNTQIQFKFIYLKATQGGVTVGKEFASTAILYCDLLIRRNTGETFQLVSAMGNYYQWGAGVTMGDGPEIVNRKNYLIHTEDTFILYWANLRYPFSQLDSSVKSPICVVGMCLRRSKDYDAFSVLTPGPNRIGMDNIPNPIKMTTSFQGSYEQFDFEYSRRNLWSWQQESSNAVENGESVIYPTMELFGNIKDANRTFYITKNMTETPVLTEDNAVILYRDVPILASTLFFGKYNKPFMFGLNLFSFMAIKPNYEVITGDLI